MRNLRLDMIGLLAVSVVVISLLGLAISVPINISNSKEKINPSLIDNRLNAYKLPDLTGTYYGDDHGIYYIKQNGNNMSWHGQQAGQNMEPIPNPLFANIAFGTINGHTINLNWIDLPNGKTSGSGTLTLNASYTGSVSIGQYYKLTVIQQTGGFGAKVLSRTIPA